MTNCSQPTLPGMEPPAKPRQLSLLYLEAAAEYYAPIAERIASERALGPEGITEADMEGVPAFLDLDAFRAELERQGVPFKEGR